MGEVYAVTTNGNGVSYVSGRKKRYFHTHYHLIAMLEPYIKDLRGVYILTGHGKVYVGEGDVLTRLNRHAHTKLWVEEVYVLVTEPMMTKEDSLNYEGAFVKYFQTNGRYELDNKDATRDTELEIVYDMMRFKWLGLVIDEPVDIRLKTGIGEVLVRLTHKDTYRVVTSSYRALKWLEGYEFQSTRDIHEVIGAFSNQEEGVRGSREGVLTYHKDTLKAYILDSLPPRPIKREHILDKYGKGASRAIQELVEEGKVIRVKRGYYILSDELLDEYQWNVEEEHRPVLTERVVYLLLSAFISRYTLKQLEESDLLDVAVNLEYYTTSQRDEGLSSEYIIREREELEAIINQYRVI